MKRTRRSLLVALLLGCVAAWLLLLGWPRSYRTEENYSLIEEGLYMGGHVEQPPPATRAVLNLCKTADPYRCAIHRCEPIPDAEPAPSIEWLREMVQFVDDNRKAGRTTYVHCMVGTSRSALVVTAYEMFKKQWSRDEALAFVRSRRPAAHPNPAFMQRLLEWDQVLKGQPPEG